MNKRKEKLTENASATETTKVVAKRIKMNATLEPEIQPTSGTSYTAAIDKVKAALANYGHSVWQLAWALVDFKAVHEQLHPADRLIDKQLAERLGIDLTPARIGQLVNTAKAYPREQVDESIDFRVYEQARTAHKLMSPEKRLALVKENPTVTTINKLKPKERRRDAPVRRELSIRVMPALTDTAEPEVTVRLNSEAHMLPTDLVTAIRTYAVEVFGKSDGTAEAAA